MQTFLRQVWLAVALWTDPSHFVAFGFRRAVRLDELGELLGGYEVRTVSGLHRVNFDLFAPPPQDAS